MKKFKIGLMVVLISTLILAISQPVFANDLYTLFIDEKQIETNSESYDNTLYYSIADVAKSIGCTITWNGVTQSITINKDSNEVIMTINNNILLNNGREIIMKHPPLIVNGRAFAPIGYIVECFGYNVQISANKTCSVIMKPEIKEFNNISNEFNSVVSKMDKLLAQDTISENERLAIKSDVENMWAKLESWGQPLGYYSIKDLYFDTLTHGLTCCFNKCFLTDPKFSIINERIKNEYEQSSKKYSSDKNKIQAELNRIQQLNYL